MSVGDLDLLLDENLDYWYLEQLTYQRAPIAVSTIVGDQVTLSSGPPVGTPVVSQAAAELVGVETGIDGEE